MSWVLVLIVWGLIAVGWMLACFANAGKKRGEAFRALCLRAEGEVVKLVEVESSEPPNTWAAQIRFSTLQNQQIEFQTKTSAYPAEYRVGQKVEVFYTPDQPEKARVAAEAYDFDGWVTGAVAAVGIFIIVVIVLLKWLV